MKDCCAATSIAGQEAAYEHTFGMFSVSIMIHIMYLLFCYMCTYDREYLYHHMFIYYNIMFFQTYTVLVIDFS